MVQKLEGKPHAAQRKSLQKRALSPGREPHAMPKMKANLPQETSSSGSTKSTPITSASPVVQEEPLWTSSSFQPIPPSERSLYHARRSFSYPAAIDHTGPVHQQDSSVYTQAPSVATSVPGAPLLSLNEGTLSTMSMYTWPASTHPRRSVSEAAGGMPRLAGSTPAQGAFHDLGSQLVGTLGSDPSELPQPRRERLSIPSSYAAAPATVNIAAGSSNASPAASLLAASSQAWADEHKNPKCDFAPTVPTDMDWSNFVHSSSSLLDSSPASQAFSTAVSHERQ